MVRRYIDKPQSKIVIRYLSDADLHVTMPFAVKFVTTPERRRIYKELIARRDTQPLVVSSEGHPIAFLLVKRARKHATVLVMEELMVGTFDKILAGRIADFLTVDYLVCSFQDFEEAETFGTAYGLVGYKCDVTHPDIFKGIGLDKMGNHPTEPLRFSTITSNMFDTYPKELLRSMTRLGVAGIYEELHYDTMDIYGIPLEGAVESELYRWFKRRLMESRKQHAVVWHVDDRKIVGMVSFETQNPFTGKEVVIRGLTIAPEYRNRGYGKLLLRYAMLHVDARATDITVDILHANIASRRIFEGTGYFNVTQVDRGTPRLINGYYKRSISDTEAYFIDSAEKNEPVLA